MLDGFDRYRPGLNPIGFAAPSRAAVDQWHQILKEDGCVVLDPPGYYGPGYYAVYFADPDGIKLGFAMPAKLEDPECCCSTTPRPWSGGAASQSSCQGRSRR
jgi:hypothetical protein